MPLGLRKLKTEEDLAQEWAVGQEGPFNAHSKAASGKTQCLVTGASKLSPESIQLMLAMLFGDYSPAKWVPDPKRPYRGKIKVQAPNRVELAVRRDELAAFFGASPEDTLSEAASGQTIGRFLQAFGAAHHAYGGKRDKISDALLRAFEASSKPTPHGLLQAARGKGKEDAWTTPEWGVVLLPADKSVVQKASDLVGKLVGYIDAIAKPTSTAEFNAITAEDLSKMQSALESAMQRVLDVASEESERFIENALAGVEVETQPMGAEALVPTT